MKSLINGRMQTYMPYVFLCIVNVAILLPAMLRPAFFCADDLHYVFMASRAVTFFRPLATIMFRVLLEFFSVDPFGYRLVEVGLHILVVLCLYGVGVLVTKKKSIAVMAALLFSCHFLHLKVTLHAVWIEYPIAAIFSLLSIIAFMKALQPGRYCRAFRLLSLLFFICAAFTDEVALVSIGVLFFYYLYNTDGNPSVRKVWDGVKLLFLHGLFAAFFVEFSCNPVYDLGAHYTADNVTNLVVCFSRPMLIMNFFTSCFMGLFAPFLYVSTYEYTILYDAQSVGVTAILYGSFFAFVGFLIWIKDLRYRFGLIWLSLFLLAGSFGYQGATLLKYVYFPLLGSSYLLALIISDGVKRLIVSRRIAKTVTCILFVLLFISSVVPCWQHIRLRFNLGAISKKLYDGLQNTFLQAPEKAVFYIIGRVPVSLRHPETYEAFIFEPLFFGREASNTWFIVQWGMSLISAKDINWAFREITAPIDDNVADGVRENSQAFYVPAHMTPDPDYVFSGEYEKYVYVYCNNEFYNLREALAREHPITFSVQCPQAQSVAIAGDFNDWRPESLSTSKAGQWEKKLLLLPGTYRYQLVVNDEMWVVDPAACEYLEHTIFGKSSVLFIPVVKEVV